VRDILNDAKTKGLEKQKNSIIESTKNWAASNTDLLSENGSILVQMETLKQEGFLENKIIKNPVTNKEMDACVLITYNGETHNITQWSEKTGIPRGIIAKRYNLGWSPKRIFETKPIEKYRHFKKGNRKNDRK
jgi:hypothetical protein